MNKGIVMEKRRRYMIVLMRNGIFQKAVPMEHTAVGDEVYFKPIASQKWPLFLFYRQQNRQISVNFIAVFCMLLLIIVPFYLTKGKDRTFAYVNIDINPSVELKIDETLRVSKMTALNKDGDHIVNKLTRSSYKNKELETVITEIMKQSEAEGLIKRGKNMLVGVSYVEEDEQDAHLTDRLRRHLSNDESSWRIAAFEVPEKVREKALKKQKTMNETMVNEIIEKDSGKENTVDKEDREIIQSFYEEK